MVCLSAVSPKDSDSLPEAYAVIFVFWWSTSPPCRTLGCLVWESVLYRSRRDSTCSYTISLHPGIHSRLWESTQVVLESQRYNIESQFPKGTLVLFYTYSGSLTQLGEVVRPNGRTVYIGTVALNAKPQEFPIVWVNRDVEVSIF